MKRIRRSTLVLAPVLVFSLMASRPAQAATSESPGIVTDVSSLIRTIWAALGGGSTSIQGESGSNCGESGSNSSKAGYAGESGSNTTSSSYTGESGSNSGR